MRCARRAGRGLGVFLIVSLIPLLPALAKAESCTGRAELAEIRACLPNPLPAYLVVLKYSGMSATETSSAIDSACRDLDDPDFKGERSLLGRLGNAFYDFIGEPMAADIPTVVRDMLGNDATTREYRARLSEIGKIKDRYVRIRRAYELAVSSQGAYDDNDEHTLMTPGHVLNRAKEGKPGGVCRDFAKLLEWSLMQVNRSPELSPVLRAWGGLDEDSFFVKQVGDIDAKHEWVDVLLPVGVGEKQVFYTVSLDTTYYKKFTPLNKRRAEISAIERARLMSECQVAAQCLQGVALKHLPVAHAPSPGANAPMCTGN